VIVATCRFAARRRGGDESETAGARVAALPAVAASTNGEEAVRDAKAIT
jgi:hypothetical protein